MSHRGRAGEAIAVAGLTLALTLPLTLTGCKARDDGTTLVINVLGDLSVPGQIDELEIDVVSDGHADGGSVARQTFTLTTSSSPLARLAVRPKGSPDFGIEVTAHARRAGAEVVAQQALVKFVPGEARQFDLFLSADCVGPGGANICADPTQVCVKGGACVGKDAVATLRPYPDSGSDARVEAPGGPDGGGADAAAPDAGRDAGPKLGTWTVSPTPNVPAQATLYKVWPVAANDVWVVGFMGTAGVTYHYDGTAWTASSPALGAPTLYSVWASATDDVWAVGAKGTILHRTSVLGWLSAPGTATAADLSSVWGFSTGDVTAVGSGGVITHWNGSSWSNVASVSANLFAVTGAGPGDLWAVGEKGTVVRGMANVWQPQSQTKSTNTLLAVWASSATNVWAAGVSVALHLSGTTWSLTTGAVDTTLGLWGSAPEDLWAVGLDSAGTGNAVTHWDGGAWTAVPVPAGSGLQGVRGTAAGDVWAVGNGGQILHYQIP